MVQRVPFSEFENDPEAIFDRVERDGEAVTLVRDGADVLLVLPVAQAGAD